MVEKLRVLLLVWVRLGPKLPAGAEVCGSAPGWG